MFLYLYVCTLNFGWQCQACHIIINYWPLLFEWYKICHVYGISWIFLYSWWLIPIFYFPFHSTIPILFHSSESSSDLTCMHHDHDSACMDLSIKVCDCGEIYIKFSIFFKISNRLVKVIDGQLIFSILQLYIQIWCFWRFWLFSWLLACTCTWQTAYVVTVII